MPTRFHFPSSGTPGISPAFDAGWEQTAAATRLWMPRAKLDSAVTAKTNSAAITVPVTTVQQILCYQFISEDVFQPFQFETAHLFSMVIRGLENVTTTNVFLAYVLRCLAADGSNTILGTLSSSMTNAGTEFVATAATRIFGNGTTTVTMSALTCGVPFRVVLEVGGHAQAPSPAGNYTYRTGVDTVADFALTSALTTDLNPWMELSCDLNATRLQNYMTPRSTGLSIGTMGGR